MALNILSRVFFAAAIMGLTAAPAAAQEIQAPRYEALDQQLQMLEQRQLDSLERQRMDSLTAPTSPDYTAAQRAMRQMDAERRQRELILRSEQDRMQAARENAISQSALPGRRIAPSSILVVSEPAQFGLPRLPDGKYYARLQGRFVIVDASSEMVETVLPVQPTDPTADIPAGPRPPLLPPAPVGR